MVVDKSGENVKKKAKDLSENIRMKGDGLCGKGTSIAFQEEQERLVLDYRSSQ